MSPEFEHVEVRTNQRVISNAARFEDGMVFVPGCEIDEGDDIEVDGDRRRVVRCEPHELQHRTGMLDETTGCLLTLEAVAE